MRVRHLFFSEKLANPDDPASAVEFYLTVDGQTPRMFDMNSNVPNIVAQQGTVEDWIIENRSSELHASGPFPTTVICWNTKTKA